MKQLYVMTLGLLLLMIAVVPATAQPQYPNGYGQQQNWRGALTPDDQQKFDHEYAKWVDSQRKNDRDDIAESARHMQDIMTRNNIPSNVPLGQNSGERCRTCLRAVSEQQIRTRRIRCIRKLACRRTTRGSLTKLREVGGVTSAKTIRMTSWKPPTRCTRSWRVLEFRANVPFAAMTDEWLSGRPSAAPYGYAQAASRRLSLERSGRIRQVFRASGRCTVTRRETWTMWIRTRERCRRSWLDTTSLRIFRSIGLQRKAALIIKLRFVKK